jgi:TrmH family RNA methyltransferase
MTKEKLKYYSSLHSKKYREFEKKFLVEGVKLITDAIESGYKCDILLFTSQFENKEKELLKDLYNKGIKSETIKQFELDKLCDTKTPQGVLGVFNYTISPESSKISDSDSVIVALENISDPGNLGAILRNCDWFGIKTVILSQNCAEIFSPKVIRSSAGTIFHLNIYEPADFYEEIKLLKKDFYKIITADLNGFDLYSYKKNNNIVLVLSNEANGPSKEILDLSDKIITIPQKGKAESLNVGSASAVLIAELTK